MDPYCLRSPPSEKSTINEVFTILSTYRWFNAECLNRVLNDFNQENALVEAFSMIRLQL